MTSSSDPQIARPNSSGGQPVVLTMIAIAIVAAAFAWRVNYLRSKRPLELYGPDAAQLIRTAPQVQILRPESEGNIDISQERGLLNARSALLADDSYDWTSPVSRQESPLYSVQFSQGEQSVVVTFDFENRTISNSATQRVATLIKKTSDGWKAYLARQSEQRKSSVP